MSNYRRVIPRDLFNEANLLKCYGQMYINAERYPGFEMDLIDIQQGGFEILLNTDSGGTQLANVVVTYHGKLLRFERPLNSRESYPLYCYSVDDVPIDEVQVFSQHGDSFHPEFRDLLKSLQPENDE